MAGRIRDEDVAAVREKTRIDEVISEHVQLRNAGGGNLKGICPFHDEKSPSLSVTPTRGLYHCFGCGAGGDVIRFVQEIEHLSFGEAVESLAARAGIQLRYAEGGPGPARQSGQRARLVEAHTLAAAFYVEQLATPQARPARDFLSGRGFDAAAAQQFGCGYAPAGWDTLTKYLLGRGFSPAELTLGGLSKESGRGSLIDRFHRRLLWPIKDIGGDVVGFGARRIHDDDKIEAKYLNSPETPIYKKNQLLYGMDVAKREIARQNTAVVVEGYTDVMACHLAGVTTAVASCGTAFGSEHVNVIRRLWSSNSAEEAAAKTKVIFTFDGDAAGMKAAEKAFADEQRFMAQTRIAIAPEGKDPCELRQSSGDSAVRALVESSRPLVEYMLQTLIRRHDLDTVEGRSAALNVAIPLVAQLKDQSDRTGYAQQVANWVGIANPDEVLARVRGLARATEQRAGAQPGSSQRGNGQPNQHGRPAGGHGHYGGQPNQPASNQPHRPAAPPQPGGGPVGVPPKLAQDEREVIKAGLQLPDVVGGPFDELGTGAFMVALHQQLYTAMVAAGGAKGNTGGAVWVQKVREYLPPESEAYAAVNALAVESLRSGADGQARYAEAMVHNLAEHALAREVARVKSQVQRTDDPGEQGRLFGRLVELEQRRRELRSRAIGGE
jgi:DNA primase